jgi:flagellar motor component MotA
MNKVIWLIFLLLIGCSLVYGSSAAQGATEFANVINWNTFIITAAIGIIGWLMKREFNAVAETAREAKEEARIARTELGNKIDSVCNGMGQLDTRLTVVEEKQRLVIKKVFPNGDR